MDLKQIDSLLRDINRMEAEVIDIKITIIDLEADISLSPIRYSDGSRGSIQGSETENKAIQLYNKKLSLENRQRKLEVLLDRIKNAVNSLDNEEKELVEMRYIKNMKYWEIADTTAKSEKQVSRKIKRILRKINEILGNR